MKVVAAYLLDVLGGNPQPSTKDLQAILRSVGTEAEDDRIKLLLTEVQGKDIIELIATGREKFTSVPSGGGGGGGGGAAISVAAAGSGGGSVAAPAAAESKKEEKIEEKEESDKEMGFSLFD